MILLVVSLKYNVDSSLVFWIIYNQNKCAFFLDYLTKIKQLTIFQMHEYELVFGTNVIDTKCK